VPARARRQAEKHARTALAAEAARLSKALRAEVSIAHAVSVGSPAAEIADRAARLKADLVVMGRGIDRPVRDSLLGSTAERVIRQARMPVLAVRLPVQGAYRHPTLGLDEDAAAESMLAMLFLVTAPPRPRATIVHAHDTPYLAMYRTELGHEERQAEERRYRQTVVPRIAETIARAVRAQKIVPADVPAFKTVVRYGDARSVIKAAVRRFDADLLLLGTHGYSGLTHVILGTVAGDVLRDVPCDVLVVPPVRRTDRRD
jgi:nucleotide-binding universal stress UspA family protein